MGARTLAQPEAANWIVTTSLDKPDGPTRKYIRSHVMRGRNTREDRRARKTAKSKVRKQNRDEDVINRPVTVAEPTDDTVEVRWAVPRKVSPEILCFRSSIDLQPYMVKLIHTAFSYVKPSQSSIDRAMIGLAAVGESRCFGDIMNSAAMIHACLFMAQSLEDHYSVLSPNLAKSTTAHYHLSQSLSLLQRDLNDPIAVTGFDTIAIVSSLATTSLLLGDIEASKGHMNGLYQVIKLSGGLNAARTSGTLVERKAKRTDFALALITGEPTRLSRFEDCWSYHYSLQTDRTAAQYPELSAIKPRPDSRLLNIWTDLRALTIEGNKSIATGIPMPAVLYHDITDSVPWRLTRLETNVTSIDELMRLTMMSLLKHILVNFRGLGKYMKYVSRRMKTAFLVHRDGNDLHSGGLLLWALFIAALTVFEDFDREWLREMLLNEVNEMGLSSWEETRVVLKSFLWLDFVFDKGGEDLFSSWVGDRRGAMEDLWSGQRTGMYIVAI